MSGDAWRFYISSALGNGPRDFSRGLADKRRYGIGAVTAACITNVGRAAWIAAGQPGSHTLDPREGQNSWAGDRLLDACATGPKWLDKREY